MGVIRSAEACEQFEKVVRVHGCRLVSEQVSKQLLDYPIVTRESFRHQGRVPALLETGRLCHDLGPPAIDRGHDRFMLCGSPAMLADTRTVLDKFRCSEGNMSRPGHCVIERAFAGK